MILWFNRSYQKHSCLSKNRRNCNPLSYVKRFYISSYSDVCYCKWNSVGRLIIGKSNVEPRIDSCKNAPCIRKNQKIVYLDHTVHYDKAEFKYITNRNSFYDFIFKSNVMSNVPTSLLQRHRYRQFVVASVPHLRPLRYIDIISLEKLTINLHFYIQFVRVFRLICIICKLFYLLARENI